MIVSQQAQQTLTVSAAAGDAEALAALLEAHDDELRTWLARRIHRRYRSAFDVDDVLQVPYIEAFLQIHRFVPKGPDAMIRWLRRIAENNLCDAIRALNRDKRPPRDRQIGLALTDESYVSLLTNLGGTATTPSESAARTEAKNILEGALKRLPPDYEKVVRMYDLMDCSTDQIAEAMDRSVGAIHMLKARAHERLTELLGRSSKFFFRGT